MTINTELLNAIEQMKDGNSEAFGIFYEHTHDYVYKRARFIMKSEEDALDLTQETFVQAYKNISSLEKTENVYAWLGAIAYRQGMRIFRDRKEVLVDEEGDYVFEDIVSEDKDYSPEENADAQATVDIVMGFIDELPELQRAAIIAFYYDNKKIDEIAEEAGCSSNTIKSRLNYAKKFLKDRVEAHEKACGYKLHSVTPFIIFSALGGVLGGNAYTISAQASEMVLAGVSGATGVAVSASGATVVATSASAGAISSVASTGAAVAAKVGLGLGAKIAIGLAAVATTAAVSVGTITLVNNNADSNTTTTTIPLADDENATNSSANVDDSNQSSNISTDIDLDEARTWIYDFDSCYEEDGSVKWNEGLTRYLEEAIPYNKLTQSINNTIELYKAHGYSYVGDETDILSVNEDSFKKHGEIYFKLQLTDPALLAELENAMLNAYIEKGNTLPEGNEYDSLINNLKSTIAEFTTLGIRVSWLSWEDTYSIWLYGEFRFNGSDLVRFTENMEWIPRWLEYNEEDKVWLMSDL